MGGRGREGKWRGDPTNSFSFTGAKIFRLSLLGVVLASPYFPPDWTGEKKEKEKEKAHHPQSTVV